MDSSRRIIDGVDPIFQWNILRGSTRLGGLVAASIDAIRSTDSNVLGGQINPICTYGIEAVESNRISTESFGRISIPIQPVLRGLLVLSATASIAAVALFSSTVVDPSCGP